MHRDEPVARGLNSGLRHREARDIMPRVIRSIRLFGPQVGLPNNVYVLGILVAAGYFDLLEHRFPFALMLYGVRY
jgi:hypothetical protein